MGDKEKREEDAKRDAVLRRMLATPKPGKGGKERAEPKAPSRKEPAERRKPAERDAP